MMRTPKRHLIQNCFCAGYFREGQSGDYADRYGAHKERSHQARFVGVLRRATAEIMNYVHILTERVILSKGEDPFEHVLETL